MMSDATMLTNFLLIFFECVKDLDLCSLCRVVCFLGESREEVLFSLSQYLSLAYLTTVSALSTTFITKFKSVGLH